MDFQTNLTKIKEQIDKAKSIIIVTHAHPTMDSLGSSLSLYLGLLGLGKNASVLCPDPVTVEFSDFVGANKLGTKITGKKNFIISLDYKEGSIEKVSYNIEGDKFNLVIEPRPGFEDFSSEKVHYSQSGGQADLIMVVDTEKLDDLGVLYTDHKDLFGEKPIINIDRHKDNAMFGAVNLIDVNVSSMSELTAVVMSYIGVKLTEDIATNLLNSLIDATEHFQKDPIGARTYEVASVCMKAGAKRFKPTQKPIEPHAVPFVSASNGQVGDISQNQTVQEQNEDLLKPKMFKNQNTTG